jgi:hypothetical protein
MDTRPAMAAFHEHYRADHGNLSGKLAEPIFDNRMIPRRYANTHDEELAKTQEEI